VETHLLTYLELKSSVAKFPNSGDNIVEKPFYDQDSQRVYININQYFEDVESEVWNSMIGGYKVCEKWLKDRKGRTLSNDEIFHIKAVTAISQTIEIQEKIDELYPQVEEGSILF